MHPKESNPGLDRVRFQLRADGVPDDTPNRLRSGIHNRGYLPHVKREGASYFVTFRLSDSLPKTVLLRFLGEKAGRLRALEERRIGSPTERVEETTEEIERDFRRKVERYLDRGYGACYLGRSEIATMVGDALRHFHAKQYLLDDWVIMPNHVHVILWPMPNFTLSEILKGRKQFTAAQGNRNSAGPEKLSGNRNHSITGFAMTRRSRAYDATFEIIQLKLVCAQSPKSGVGAAPGNRNAGCQPARAGMNEGTHLLNRAAVWHWRRCRLAVGETADWQSALQLASLNPVADGLCFRFVTAQ